MRGGGGSVSKSENERSDIQVDALFDIETEGWSTFLIGGLYDGETYIERRFEEEDRYAQEVAGSGSAWAWNGGRFDAKWLLERLRVEGASVSVTCAGSRITEARRGDFRALDACALFPLSLAKASRGLSVRKHGNPLQCHTPEICGPGCAGYCRFKRGMGRSEWAAVREYLRADCESAWLVLQKLREWAALNDADLAPTIGGSSWRNVRRLVGVDGATLTLSEHRFVRKAYFGGRVQVFRPSVGKGISADVNSLYPACLACTPLPVGLPVRRYGTDAALSFARGSPGFFSARVHVPEMWIPVLPVRTTSRVAYPTGTISGTWAGAELRYTEEQGCKILEVNEAMVWPQEQVLFWQWVQKYWTLRRNAPGGKSSPLGKFCKLYLNSLVGKFGMRPGGHAYSINPDLSKSDKWEMLSEGVFRMRRPSVRKVKNLGWVAGAPCSRIEWAATILAQARIVWHRQAVRCGRALVYGDTDNVKATCGINALANVGDALGQWLQETSFEEFEAIAPKFYRERPESSPEMGTAKGEYRYRSKGVRSTRPEDWEALYSGNGTAFTWNASTGFRTASRGGSLFTSSTITRKISRGYGDRILDSDGTTRPPSIEELAA